MAVFLMMVISISLLSGCGSKNAEKEDAETNELNSGMNSIDYNVNFRSVNYNYGRL